MTTVIPTKKGDYKTVKKKQTWQPKNAPKKAYRLVIKFAVKIPFNKQGNIFKVQMHRIDMVANGQLRTTFLISKHYSWI